MIGKFIFVYFKCVSHVVKPDAESLCLVPDVQWLHKEWLLNSKKKKVTELG